MLPINIGNALALPFLRAMREFYRLATTHVSDLPRLAAANPGLRVARLILQPTCSIGYKICSSNCCSVALPLLYFFDSLTKGILGVCIPFVVISSIFETNARFALLTIPALCYAILLAFFAPIKSTFGSWSYFRSNEVLILAGNGFVCVVLFVHALHFDQRPTKEDNTVKFTKTLTIWLCKLEIAITIEWAVCSAIQWFHEWRKHSPKEALRNQRLTELHRTFKDIRVARYGGLTSMPDPKDNDEAGDSCVYFPRDALPAGRSISVMETDEIKLFPRFLRCSCCIDDSASSYPLFTERDNERNDNNAPSHLEYRSNRRTEFLAHPAWQHLPSNSDGDAPASFNAHSLCNICHWICCASDFIQARDSFNPTRHFGLHIQEREFFEHYSTPQELLVSVNNGCHLCALIWASMSPVQRESLLAADVTIQNQLEQALASAPEGDERKEIENRYRKRRRVRLVIESFDSDIPPTDSQLRLTHSLEPGKGAAQIVPHFGRFQRPRRWMTCIRDFEDHMLVERGESEFAPPILILQCHQQINGPIQMPFSDSTGSGFAMSLMRSWLDETESSESTSFLPGRVLHVESALKFGIVRVMDRHEIVRQALASKVNGNDASMMDGCVHKFAMGCLNSNGQQCCSCLAGELECTQKQSSVRVRQFTYCPRCKEYLMNGGARKYKLPQIEISGEPKSTQYVALSHCWGENTKFLKLTMENQHSLRLGLFVTTLTKTFQEAIQTTASLGYSFLWIDSLCIIQDSKEDWKRESATMGDIYKNSAFCIVASAAWGGTEGLFRKQDVIPNHPCVLGVRSRGEITYAIPAQMDIEKTRRIELELCKWNRRGWCLQERALSRRIIFFGESQLHFELKDAFGGIVHLQSQGDERAYFEPNRLRPESSVARGYSSNMWWEYVNSYTQRQLTYLTDKPSAIQGLATSMEDVGIPMSLSALNSEISLRGFALNEFIASLLWFVDKNTTSRPSSETDNFPTWSWLSVDGVVFNDSAGEVYENSTLTIKELIEPAGECGINIGTMFASGVKGLRLKVNGKLRGARWKAVHDQFYFARRAGVEALCASPPGYREEELVYTRHLAMNNRGNPGWWPRSEGRFEYLEMIKPVSNDAEMGPVAHVLQTDTGLPIGWLIPDTTAAIPEEIHCLEIRVEPTTPVEKYKLINTWVVRGLALDRVGSCPNTQLPVYSRIGYIELDQRHKGFLHTDLAFDWQFPPAERKDLRNNFLRKWPDVDPHGFFKNVPEQDFIIR